MKTIWTQGLEKQDAEEIRSVYDLAEPLRKRLEKLLEDRIFAYNKSRNSRSHFLMPGWKYYQADIGGYIRALEEIKQLISDQGKRK